LKPKVFVMENVSGMVKGKMKLIFAEILKELKASGYKVSARLLNAMYFGVPQSRQRMIFIGIREDLDIKPVYPPAISIPIIFKDACINIDKDEEYRYLGEMLLNVAKKQPQKWSTDKKIYINIKGNSAGSFSTKWAGYNRVCGTIPKSEIATMGIIHPNRKRYLSINEMKRLFSFPDEYVFIGDRTNKVGRMGNSVPPLFMRSIAKHIRSEILSHSRKLSEG